MSEPQKLEVIDNPSVAELYANKLVGASFDGGAVLITLGATRRFMPEKGAKAKEGSLPPVHVTARLAISPAGTVELANHPRNAEDSQRNDAKGFGGRASAAVDEEFNAKAEVSRILALRATG